MPHSRRVNPQTATALVLAVTAAIICSCPLVQGQGANADWQKAAGGTMSFDVASVKSSPMSAPRTNPIIPLDSGDGYPGNTTLFSANIPLGYYIAFAYKVPVYQDDSLISQLPKWATSQRFNIQARAASPSTKDQMRLMMQSLLADRFKMQVHWEKHNVASYELVLIKSGKTGPQLQPHNGKIPCQPYAPDPSGYDHIPGRLPAFCGRLVGGGGPGGVETAGRNINMVQLADSISGVFNRVVIDKTGLTGGFDINMDLRFHLSPTDLQQFGLGDIQTGYVEAFRDQLGLKLEPGKTQSAVLIIDHIEQPTPN